MLEMVCYFSWLRMLRIKCDYVRYIHETSYHSYHHSHGLWTLGQGEAGLLEFITTIPRYERTAPQSP